MRKLFHYLKMYKGWIACILCILIVQAYSDLSLPSYTSDIVNIGIQQGGIATKVPTEMTEKDFDSLLLFVEDTKQEVMIKAYEQIGEIYYLKQSISEDEEALRHLSDVMVMPMIMAMNVEVGAEINADTTQDQLLAKRHLEDMPEMVQDQIVVSYIRQAYENTDRNLETMQSQYIMTTGMKMLAFALLSMCASVMVGLIGAQVAAKVGHHLRSRVFYCF